MAFLLLSKVFKYLDATADSRCVVEGQGLLSSKMQILCGVTKVVEGKYSIAALCLQTSALTSAPHEIHGELWQRGTEVDVQSFTCTCKAGLSGTCKHVSACLLYCSRYNLDEIEKLSSTDLTCYWNKNKVEATNIFQPKPVQSFKCIKAVKRCRSLTPDEENDCLMKLRTAQSTSILHKHSLGICGGPSKKRKIDEAATDLGREKEAEVINLSDDLVHILQHSEESPFLESLQIEVPPLKPCCLEILQRLSSDSVAKSAVVTQNSEEWFELRRLRITGSKCYSIFTYTKDNWEKKSNTFFFPKNFKTAATEHGKKYEMEAFTTYRDISKGRVVSAGFIICKKFPWLGYSPDGIVFNETGSPEKLLEIKCPLKGLEEDANSLLPHCKYLRFENGVLTLKKKHQYYGQLQLGMAILNLKISDLIIYSPKSKTFLSISVPFDVDFASQLLQKVSDKYFNKMIYFVCI